MGRDDEAADGDAVGGFVEEWNHWHLGLLGNLQALCGAGALADGYMVTTDPKKTTCPKCLKYLDPPDTVHSR